MANLVGAESFVLSNCAEVLLDDGGVAGRPNECFAHKHVEEERKQLNSTSSSLVTYLCRYEAT